MIYQQGRTEAGASGNDLGAPFSLWSSRSVLTYSPPTNGRWYCLRQLCSLRGASLPSQYGQVSRHHQLLVHRTKLRRRTKGLEPV